MTTTNARNQLFSAIACMLFLTVSIEAHAQSSNNGSTMGQPPPMAQQGQMQPNHEKSSGYVDNSAITMKVKAMLMKDESLKSLDIHVTTKHDVVTLTGTVKNMTESDRAGEIAKNVEGVKMVRNHLKQNVKD